MGVRDKEKGSLWKREREKPKDVEDFCILSKDLLKQTFIMMMMMMMYDVL